MKPHNFVSLLVLILCSLTKQAARGGVHEEKNLTGKSETGISPSLNAKLKAIVNEKFVSINSQVYERAPKPLVLEENETKVMNSLHKEDTPRIGDHLDGPDDLLLNATSRSDFPCPDAASIAPCDCSFDADFNIDLNCTNVESDEQLAAVFMQEFPIKELRGFNMVRNDKLKVIGNILNGITFRNIQFWGGPFTIEIISDYFLLANKDSLTELKLESSQIISDTFPFAVLGEMKKLYLLHLHGNALITWIPKITAPVMTVIIIDYAIIDTIETGTFPISADRMDVQLHGNQITFIEPGSFCFVDENSAASNAYLRYILHTNRLQSLEAGVYLLRDGPMILIFDHNQISSIAPGTFALPPTTVHFSIEFHVAENLLTTIDEVIFGELFPFVTTFFIHGNPLLCGCDIAWIVLNSDYMAKIDAEATCEDGTNLHTLDPAIYGTVC